MSGKHATKRQKLTRKASTLNVRNDTCPYCEEEWPMDLLVEHMTSCEKSYLTRGQRKMMRGRSRSLLYNSPQSEDTFYDFDRSRLFKSSSSKTFRLMPPYSAVLVTEEDESDLSKSESPGAGMSSVKEINGSETKGADKLIQNLEDLLHNEWCSDVVLKNTDHEFRAHRLILGARSPAFAAMFQHDMVEKTTGEVDISDCSTAAFKAFLQYLYSGKADMSSINVVDLYYTADKYQVDDLKADCAVFMKNSLSVYNCCDIIDLSIRHNQSDLQSIATQFFCRYIKTIVRTTQWQKYLTENPIHANQLIIKALNA